jgi:hypothetical protein
MADPFSSPDEARTRLYGTGWSSGETATAAGWLVTRQRGEEYRRPFFVVPFWRAKKRTDFSFSMIRSLLLPVRAPYSSANSTLF